MYPLLDIYPADQERALATIVQGTDSVLRFARGDDAKAFLDRLLIADEDARGPELFFQTGGRQFRAHRHIEIECIGLVSDQPTILRHLSIHDNLELIANRLPYAADLTFPLRVAQALEETRLLAGINLARTAEFLPWSAQVELNFLQSWLCEPQWLIFDGVFEHPDSQSLIRLPSLFRQRFPLRGITYLQQGSPLPASFNAQQEVNL